MVDSLDIRHIRKNGRPLLILLDTHVVVWLAGTRCVFEKREGRN